MSTARAHSSESEPGRAFLQRRVALFGLYGSSLGWFFLVFRVLDAFARDQPSPVSHPSFSMHLLAAASLLGIWLLSRGRPHSARYLRAVELSGTLLACTFYSLMASSIPYHQSPHYIVILALLLGLVTRAVYVPSRASVTAFATAAAGIPMLIVTYSLYRDFPVADWAAIEPDYASTDSQSVATGATIFALAWWVCAVAVCTGTSQVIYGLRRQVRVARKLGQYTLVEKLGEGGMGTVYRATHAMLRRPTALKLLPADKAGETAIARFEKEVQHTAMLTHPNTVTIFDFGRTPDGIFYYVMELLDGATLSDVVAIDGPQPAGRVVHILSQVAGALAEAHRAGLIHRDIKPANVMLVDQGATLDVAKVLDFGLVRKLATGDDAGVTHAGSVTGTPQYLAPEAITSPADVDARIDLYALGAVGYFLLTGQHVFTGNTVVEICAAHLHDAPVPPSERLGRALPADLERLILRCLAKNPDDRPHSARELLRELGTCTDVPVWTEDDARAWWHKHGDEVAALHRHDSHSDRSLTIDVDLARRPASR